MNRETMKDLENAVELIIIVTYYKHITNVVRSSVGKLNNVLRYFKDDTSSEAKKILKINVRIVFPQLRKRENLNKVFTWNAMCLRLRHILNKLTMKSWSYYQTKTLKTYPTTNFIPKIFLQSFNKAFTNCSTLEWSSLGEFESIRSGWKLYWVYQTSKEKPKNRMYI